MLSNGQIHNIRQIEFSLGVIIPYSLKPPAEVGRIGAENACVTQVYAAFFRGGVRPFHNAFHIACIGYNTAITGRVRRAHGQQGQPYIGLASFFQQSGQCLCGNKGVVGIKNGNISFPKPVSSLQGSVGSAQPFVLDDHGVGGGNVCHIRHFRPNYDHQTVKHLCCIFKQVGQHGPASKVLQGLGPGGLHTGA